MLFDKNLLAPAGSTGNITAPAGIGRALGADYGALAFQFVVEVAGATPTITYKFQGAPDGVNWYDIGYITDASDTISQAARTMTAVGGQIQFLSNPSARVYTNFRVVTSANTNITFRAEMYQIG